VHGAPATPLGSGASPLTACEGLLAGLAALGAANVHGTCMCESTSQSFMLPTQFASPPRLVMKGLKTPKHALARSPCSAQQNVMREQGPSGVIGGAQIAWSAQKLMVHVVTSLWHCAHAVDCSQLCVGRHTSLALSRQGTYERQASMQPPTSQWVSAHAAASIFVVLKMPNPNLTYWTDGWTTTFNIYAQVGLVTLVGLVSKNGILIVEFANQLQRRGLSKLDAVREAAATRLRPVLMTSFATVCGHFPLTLVTGAGAAARNSIGLVIVSGMALGTLFMLFVLPSVYVLLARDHHAEAESTNLADSLATLHEPDMGLIAK
jgi:hypothetical protein